MKTTSLIAPALFISSLLLSGCSGLDDGPGEENPSDFEGTYQFFTSTDFGTCTVPTGPFGISMRVSKDGTVSSDPKTDRSTGETIRLTGHVRSSGAVNGNFRYSFSGHSGTYDGIMSTIECEEDEDDIITDGGGGGTWTDFQSGVSDCDGTWIACIVNQRIRN